MHSEHVEIPVYGSLIKGNLSMPENSKGIVIFSCGPENNFKNKGSEIIASAFHQSGLSTLKCNLFDTEENNKDRTELDIWLHSRRLRALIEWQANHNIYSALTPVLFGSGVGTASALRIAAGFNRYLRAVVSLNGRPDLASEHLAKLSTPTLLIIGGYDSPGLWLSLYAMEKINCRKKLVIIPGVSGIIDEQDTLQKIANHASAWFLSHIQNTFFQPSGAF